MRSAIYIYIHILVPDLYIYIATHLLTLLTLLTNPTNELTLLTLLTLLTYINLLNLQYMCVCVCVCVCVCKELRHHDGTQPVNVEVFENLPEILFTGFH